MQTFFPLILIFSFPGLKGLILCEAETEIIHFGLKFGGIKFLEFGKFEQQLHFTGKNRTIHNYRLQLG